MIPDDMQGTGIEVVPLYPKKGQGSNGSSCSWNEYNATDRTWLSSVPASVRTTQSLKRGGGGLHEREAFPDLDVGFDNLTRCWNFHNSVSF